jgi:arginine N-succinyltransferase
MLAGGFIVRPAQMGDVNALEELAALTLPSVHTLARTTEQVSASVERSIASFAAHVDIASEESYLFVLASTTDGHIAGTAAIHASAGSNGTYFAFRNDVIQQVSRDLDLSHSVHALTLCSELTAYSQLSGFCMRDAGPGEPLHAVQAAQAALLSRARLLFAALAPHRFSDRFFVPLAGVTDDAGQSPFWDAVGRKFFQMDFLDAERVIGGARNRTLILELMPHYPIYVPLLPGAAQAVMGQIHASGEVAFNLLTEEGFEADDYIDLFDGGPILQAHKHGLHSFTASIVRTVADMTPDAVAAVATGELTTATTWAIASGSGANFRAITWTCIGLDAVTATTDIDLPPALQQALNVSPGDDVICVRI